MAFSRVRSKVTAALAALSTACLVAACGGGSPPEAASPAQAAVLAQHSGLFGIVNDNVDLACAVFRACSAATMVTGIFDDAPTQGLTYTCSPSGRTGITNAIGQFVCPASDATVDFTLPVGAGAIIELGHASVPPVTGVHVPVTALLVGQANVGVSSAEVLQALNHGSDSAMDVSGIILSQALVNQINSYIANGGTLPAGMGSDDQFLAAIQGQAGIVAFTHRATGTAKTFLQNTVLPRLQDMIVAISATNPPPVPTPLGITHLSGTILVNGSGIVDVPDYATCTWVANGGGVLNATVVGDISKPGLYQIATSSPGFAESVTLHCPATEFVPAFDQSQNVAVSPFADNGLISVTASSGGNALSLPPPAALPFGCVGGNITGMDIGLSNPLITLNLNITCDFGYGAMSFGVVAKMVGSSW